MAAHASSDGTNNRSLLMAANALRGFVGPRSKLIIAMDANSAEKFKHKDMEKGAADEEMFSAHIAQTYGDERDLQSCMSARLISFITQCLATAGKPHVRSDDD